MWIAVVVATVTKNRIAPGETARRSSAVMNFTRVYLRAGKFASKGR